jgi:hypothetical protein
VRVERCEIRGAQIGPLASRPCSVGVGVDGERHAVSGARLNATSSTVVSSGLPWCRAALPANRLGVRATRPAMAGAKRKAADSHRRLAAQRDGDQAAASAFCAAVAASKHLLHLPKPRKRGSGLPSPVLKLAWQRRHTYILELDIIGLMPGSDDGRAAEYSAWVCRNLTLSDAAPTGLTTEAGTDFTAGVLGFAVAMARESTSQVEPARQGFARACKNPIVGAVTSSCLTTRIWPC